MSDLRHDPLFIIPIVLMLIISPAKILATNESSWIYGYMNSSLRDPQIEPGSNFYAELSGGVMGDVCHIAPASILNTAAIMPAITNVTACKDGFFTGYKEWCTNHAVDCVGNITMGDFSDMILKAHDQLLAGENAANGSGNSMCPIGNNAVFCRGWDSNNGDYGCQDCSDSRLANITTDLVGCQADIMTAKQIGGLHILVGKWNFVNQTETEVSRNMSGISGTFLFNNNGYMKMTVPNHSSFGNYELEGSWGYSDSMLRRWM
jgi:hypothetical protein